jgi:hypothetical protein
MQEAISSGLGYGGAGALQGLFDPQGTLLGGFTENAFYGALAPAAGKLFGKAKSASKAAKGSSPAKASDINMERVKEVAEELRVQEAMEKAAEVQAAAQAAAANAAASSAIMRLRGSSRAARGANVTADRIGVPGESLVLSRLQQRPVSGVVTAADRERALLAERDRQLRILADLDKREEELLQKLKTLADKPFPWEAPTLKAYSMPRVYGPYPTWDQALP